MESTPVEIREIPVLEIDREIRKVVVSALAEDIRDGDVTTLATIPEDEIGMAKVIAKQDGVVCGTELFTEIFQLIDESLGVIKHVEDGVRVKNGTTVFSLEGPLLDILQGERVALNFLGMLSGIATMTSMYVDAVSHTDCKITDTRKTTPLLRSLQKYAVQVGGGVNHRMGLYDMVMIKDNHIDGCGGLTQSVKRVRERWGCRYQIEVETRTMEEVHEAVDLEIDRIMLDNMDIETLRQAVQYINHRVETEASGGITLETVGRVAETGADFISVGALTHSFPCMDFSKVLNNLYYKEDSIL